MHLNTVEPTDGLQSRAFKRFTVPGAAVSWMPEGGRAYSEESLPLADISRGGVAFLSHRPPNAESRIGLVIFLPEDGETLELRGRVVYSKPLCSGLVYPYRVGVEVRAFVNTDCSGRGDSQKVIEVFESRYAKDGWD